LFNTIVASIYLKETLSKTNDFTKDSDFSLKTLFLPEKEIFPFYLVSILTLFSWRLTFSNLNAILVDSYKLNTFQLGLMAGTFSLTWGLTQAPIGVFIDKYPKKLFFLLSQIGFLIIVLGYSFSQSFTVFLFLQVINGIAHSFGTPALTSMIMTRVNKEARATVLAKLSTIPQIVSVPAPILSGYFYDLFGFKFLLYLRFFILLMTIVIIVRFIESKN
jgi:sugar phosphate permease